MLRSDVFDYFSQDRGFGAFQFRGEHTKGIDPERDQEFVE